jgi:hypothetical protein
MVENIVSLFGYLCAREYPTRQDAGSLYLQQSIHFTMRLTRTPPSVHEGRVGAVYTGSSTRMLPFI